MPELPEVETIRAHLAASVTGRRFARVQILDSRLTRPADPDAVARELQGERVQQVRRRGKYVVFVFESGRHLLVHLRMTGTFGHDSSGRAGADPYRRAVVSLDDGSDVIYRDVRRFGTWHLLEPSELEPYWDGRLGVEPLEPEFTARHLADALAGRRAPIKAAVLDQRTVAGVGNIYADEALWRARLHPLRPSGSLTFSEVSRLRRAVRSALEAGIAHQGATLRDYRAPDGATGTMQDKFKVYGRTGEPCDRCGIAIEKARVAGRGTWYCPRCQALRAP